MCDVVDGLAHFVESVSWTISNQPANGTSVGRRPRSFNRPTSPSAPWSARSLVHRPVCCCRIDLPRLQTTRGASQRPLPRNACVSTPLADRCHRAAFHSWRCSTHWASTLINRVDVIRNPRWDWSCNPVFHHRRILPSTAVFLRRRWLRVVLLHSDQRPHVRQSCYSRNFC